MLAALPPALLGRLRFPLTELTKPEVREIAARHGLAVAKKPESQDLCFLAGQGKRELPAPPRRPARARRRRARPRAARALGRHRGHHNFTVGQRRGIGVSAPEPLYVLATDAAANTVTVGTRARARGPPRSASATPSCTATAPASTRSACATARAPVPGRGRRRRRRAATPRSRSSWARTSSAPRPGQTAVLLAGEAIVGHGTIAAAA